MLNEATTAHPTLALPPAEFIRFIAERVPAQWSDVAQLKSLHAADLYVACGCARHKVQAIEYLRSLFATEIRGDVRRVSSASDFVFEVEQHVAATLVVADTGKASKILEYSGRGPLGGWLRAVALGTALNLRRKRRDWHEHEDADDALAELPVDVERPRTTKRETGARFAGEHEPTEVILQNIVLVGAEDEACWVVRGRRFGVPVEGEKTRAN
jgi:hypothetical protein